MAKTVIDIDEDLLAYAAEVLGTPSKRATVEAALRVVTAERARARELDAIAVGEFDLTDARDQAWR